MAYWLIIFFLTPQGDFVEKKELRFRDEASCWIAADKALNSYRGNLIVQAECVSNDHYTGLKPDPGVPLD